MLGKLLNPAPSLSPDVYILKTAPELFIKIFLCIKDKSPVYYLKGFKSISKEERGLTMIGFRKYKYSKKKERGKYFF